MSRAHPAEYFSKMPSGSAWSAFFIYTGHAPGILAMIYTIMQKLTRIPLLMACFLVAVTPAFGEGNVFTGDLNEQAIQQKRQNYPEVLKKLGEYRQQQGERYRRADEAQKAAILKEVRSHLEHALRAEVFPAWFGTDWAFHGTTTKPGEGAIACGYFVSTCLQQIGFKVERIKLAQQPSQRIIETLMGKTERDVLAGGKPMDAIKAYLKKKGDGIYIVGLDKHVGFVSVVGEKMAFIHSSYYEPESFVKSEGIDGKNPLSDSQYRVFGKIFSDEMIRSWLAGREFPVKLN